jgi:hypothetical protein
MCVWYTAHPRNPTVVVVVEELSWNGKAQRQTKNRVKVVDGSVVDVVVIMEIDHARGCGLEKCGKKSGVKCGRRRTPTVSCGGCGGCKLQWKQWYFGTKIPT